VFITSVIVTLVKSMEIGPMTYKVSGSGKLFCKYSSSGLYYVKEN